MRKLWILILLFAACTKSDLVAPGEGFNEPSVITYELFGTADQYRVTVELNDFETLDTVVNGAFKYSFTQYNKGYLLIYAASNLESYINLKIHKNGKLIASKSGYYSNLQINNEVEY